MFIKSRIFYAGGSSVLSKSDLKRYYFSVSRVQELERKSKANANQPPHVLQRKREVLRNKFKALNTVEEKLLAVNMPRYYGFKSLSLREDFIPYNSLKALQYLTKTHIASESYLPREIVSIGDESIMQNVFPNIRNTVEDSIVFESNHRLRKNELPKEIVEDKCSLENVFANAIIYQVNRAMLNNLANVAGYEHLAEYAIDYEPRIEAFWYNTGMDAPNYIKKEEKKFPDQDYLKGQDYELPIQYIGSPVLQLRHKDPLTEVWNDQEVYEAQEEFDVPEYSFCPIAAGFHLKRRHATNIPGFWPGDPAQFGILSYHNRGYMWNRESGFKDEQNVLTSQALLTSYSWLVAQACYQGFTPFNDMTYPLITQTVITNGKWWSFCTYQLNTMVLQDKYYRRNQSANLLWMTPPMKLYDEVVDNKVIGFNEDVLTTLMKFYMNVPERRENIQMMPYLGKRVKYVAYYPDRERRNWLEKHYKHLVANRPRYRRIPEIPDWQRIYYFGPMRYHTIRRRDPWQFGVNPMRRRLNEHARRYVPKCLRKYPKIKRVGRFEKTYYPFS